jgi:hypothetical protein
MVWGMKNEEVKKQSRPKMTGFCWQLLLAHRKLGPLPSNGSPTLEKNGFLLNSCKERPNCSGRRSTAICKHRWLTHYAARRTANLKHDRTSTYALLGQDILRGVDPLRRSLGCNAARKRVCTRSTAKFSYACIGGSFVQK